ncbi:MAG: TonB-dependent receptor [Gammaproteobacteria bacterium]|nr:TonB-dependent receptor [Gammaproteobacteria bacterium]
MNNVGKVGVLTVSAVAMLGLSVPAGRVSAQDEADATPGSDPVQIEEIDVIGVTPSHGTGLPITKFPSNVQSADSDEIRASGAPDITQFMNQHLGSVHVNDAQNNPLQKDVQYRGFLATPLLGAAQGISVYQDGVRLNEPFGDSVNWAIIPDSAIGSINLIPGSNPLFGRNTLGGALSIQTKNGFTHPGTRGEVYGGSFDRWFTQLENGGSSGDWGWFITGELFDEQGWRDYSPTEAKNLFGNLTWLASDRTNFDLSVNLAETELVGNGATPIELLQQDREAIFTRPDFTGNELAFFNLRGTHQATPSVLFTGNVYYRVSDTSTLNGDESDYGPCSFNPAIVCEGGGEEAEEGEESEEEIAVDPALGPVPSNIATVGDEDAGIAPGTNNRSDTDQDGYGTAFQTTFLQDLFERENQFIIGVEADYGDTDFRQSTELGRLDDTRQTIGSGFFVQEQVTDLTSDVENYSAYFTDTLSVTEALAVTVAGRFNHTNVTIEDRSGLDPELNGDHTFNRFNPAAGAAYTFAPALTVFGGYNESNRIPTPSELTCADPEDPCRLPNAFVADPPLDEVVARTFEFGVRGDVGRDLSYSLAAFNTENEDDILFITEGNITGEGFFDNVGDTRRRGIELGLEGSVLDERFNWFFNYTYLEAEFRDSFLVASEEHPVANDAGQIQVGAGDRLPLVPEHLLKAGADLRVLPNASVGFDLILNGDQVLRGDESNQLDEVDSYTLVNFNGEYRVTDHVSLFARVENVFDEDYETFGAVGEEPGEVLLNDFDDPRFFGPGAPRGGWVGLRASF